MCALDELVEMFVEDQERDRDHQLLEREAGPHHIADRPEEEVAFLARAHEVMRNDPGATAQEQEIRAAGRLDGRVIALLPVPDALDEVLPVVVVAVVLTDHPVVASLQSLDGHQLRDEIQIGGAVDLDARLVDVEESSFGLQAVEKRRLLDGEEDPRRRERDPGLAQELELVVEDPVVVGIEADDHAGDNHQVPRLHAADLVDERALAADIHLLRSALQRVGARRLDADEDRHEIRLLQEIEDVGHLGDVERQLAAKCDRELVRQTPVAKRRQQPSRVTRVADQVRIAERNVLAACRMHRFDFGNDLLDRLGARPPAIGHDDVAELAVERAAAAGLEIEVEVHLGVEEIVPRRRRVHDVDLVDLMVVRLPHALGKVAAELGPGVLDLALEHRVEEADAALGTERRVWSAGHDVASALFELARDFERAAVLDVEHRYPDDVRLGIEVDRLDLLVADLDLPVAGRERRNGGEAERNLGALHPDDLLDAVHAPQGIWKTRA